MNVFIVGLPKSGRTTVAKAIESSLGLIHLNISDWLKSKFRQQYLDEHEQHYKEEFQNFFFNCLKQNPEMCINYANEFITNNGINNNYIIEGVMTPKDFIHLFDISKDVVVFLNRTDNNEFYQDHDNISLPTMRDYCFWLSSAGLLQKPKWFEYNFKIPGEVSDSVKMLGSKNSVFLIKSIEKTIQHLDNKLKDLFVQSGNI